MFEIKKKKHHRCDHLEYTINKAQQSLHANPCDIFCQNKYNTTKSCNNQNHDELTYKHQRNKTIQQQGISVSNANTAHNGNSNTLYSRYTPRRRITVSHLTPIANTGNDNSLQEDIRVSIKHAHEKLTLETIKELHNLGNILAEQNKK